MPGRAIGQSSFPTGGIIGVKAADKRLSEMELPTNDIAMLRAMLV
jgi:hypothetical protein